MMRKIFTLVTGLLFVVLCNAQQINWDWARNYRSTVYMQSTGITASKDGSIFYTGLYTDNFGFGTDSFTVIAGSDFFITRFVAGGGDEWTITTQQPTGPGGIETNGITTDDSDNVYITGLIQPLFVPLSDSVNLNNTSSIGHYNSFVAKYNAQGIAVWGKCPVTDASTLGTAIATGLNGGIYVVGSFSGDSIGFGNLAIYNTVNYNVTSFFVARYNAAGHEIWAESCATPGARNNAATGTATDANGHIYVTGWFNNSIGIGSQAITAASISATGVFIAKYDTSGNVLWAKGSLGDAVDVANSIATDASGNVYITGSFTSDSISFGGLTLYNAEPGTLDTDFFIVKYDVNGNALWAQGAGGTKQTNGYSVATDAHNNVYVTGSFSSDSIRFDSTTLYAPAGATDPMFIVTYDSSGNINCADALPSGGFNGNATSLGNYGTRQNGVCIDPLGNAYLGGVYNINSFTLGGDVLPLTGTSDAFIGRFSCGLQTGLQAINENATLQLYPNPFANQATVRYALPAGEENAVLIIYDLSGRRQCVYKLNNNVGEINISANTLASGVYFYSLVVDGKPMATQKMVVQE